MIFIFENLPLDVIKYILTFNENFLIANNKIISFILKNDFRYDILKYITLKYSYDCPVPKWCCIKYHYEFVSNKYTSLWREKKLDYNDKLCVIITSSDKSIKYEIKIRRLQKRDYPNEKYKCMLREYVWKDIEYKYTRK
jgi:hypothetical protein